MDKTDREILMILLENSRASINTIAKRVGVSREVASYRIKKLQEKGIIYKFITRINIEKMGYVNGALFIDIKADKEKDFKTFVKDSEYVSWMSEHTGIWSFGLSIIGKSIDEVNSKFRKLYERFKEDIIDYRLTFIDNADFFWEKSIGCKTSSRKAKHTEYKIDEIDKKILLLLSENARIDYVELSKHFKITSVAIKKRIKKLEASGYIEQYTTFLSFPKLDLQQYSVFIRNTKQYDELITYLTEHPKVVFIVEYHGDPFLEFGIIVENAYELRPLIQEIEHAFPNNRIQELSLVQEDLVFIGPPKRIFD